MMTYNLPLKQMGFVELESLQLVLQEYRAIPASYDSLLDENAVGYNSNSGYTYIALECGVTIGCNDGQTVEFIATDFETGEEYIADDFSTALDWLNELII